jgi:hypothetical protein
MLHRAEIDTSAGASSEGSLDGRRTLFLVRVRLFDSPGVVDDVTGLTAGEPDVYTDLRPHDARRLAIGLLEHAEQAERMSGSLR